MMLPWLEDPWNRFAARLEQDRLPHALLVTGPAGTGKGQLAEAMINGLLCLEGGPEACGQCRSCKLLAGGAHPDRFRVEPEEGKTQITVDAVRELLSRLVLTTTISPRKVALITPAEAMNRNAANALLKTLEEPAGETVMVLVSHDPSRLPVTVRSRCQDLSVAAPDRGTAVEWLKGQGVSMDDAQLALEATGGSPLRSRELAGSEALDRYRSLQDELEQLVGKPSRAAVLATDLQGLDGPLAWTWLSLAAAKALVSSLGSATPATTTGQATGGSAAGANGAGGAPWPVTDYALPSGKIAALQAKADRYRALLGSGLRQDLLLREWLIEWARLPAREPIR